MLQNRRTLALGFVDQAVVAFGSLALLVLAARMFGSDDLGVFVSALTTAQIGVVIVRSLTGEVLLILDDDVYNSEVRIESSFLQFCFVTSLVPVSVGVTLITLGSGPILVGFGAGLVLLLPFVLQDTLRYLLIRRGDVGELCLVDLCILVGQLIFITICTSRGLPVLGVILLAGCVPAVIAIARLSKFLHFDFVRGTFRWLRISFSYSGAFAVEAIIGALVQWLSMFSVAYFSSIEEAAAFRSVIVIFGITNVVLAFLRSSVLRYVVSGGRLTSVRAVRSAAALTGFVSLTIGASYLLLASLPNSVGESLLGPTWVSASALLAVGALSRFSAALATIPGVLLRAARVTWPATTVRLSVSALSLVSVPLAIYHSGAEGGFIAMAVFSLAMALALSALIPRSIRRQGASVERVGF